jgi:hypothetical protein
MIGLETIINSSDGRKKSRSALPSAASSLDAETAASSMSLAVSFG